MLELSVILVVPSLIALPHFLALDSVAPRTATTIWMLALSLRAIVVAAMAIFIFIYLPETLLSTVPHLCWNAVIPLVATDLGLSGHAFIDTAAILPGLVMAGSVLWMLFSLGRASVLLRAHVKRRCLGEAMGCTVVEDDGIVVAVPRLGRSRIVLSRAALELMDPEELEASIAHEQAHTRRGHRSILVLGSVLAASGRLLPGTRAAEQALILSIERDADEYAVRETRKPLALASAICKAAGDGGAASAFAALAGGGGLAVRLEYLVSGGRRRTSVVFERTMLILAALMCAVTIMLVASLPAWALAHPADDAFASAAAAQCEA